MLMMWRSGWGDEEEEARWRRRRRRRRCRGGGRRTKKRLSASSRPPHPPADLASAGGRLHPQARGSTATVAAYGRTTLRAPSVADLRIGIVGAGWIAGTHAASLALLDGARIVASADVVPGRADYVDWRAMLRAERLDALVVCTPPDVHREVTVAAAHGGLAVYLEKPVAHTMDDAAAIAAAVKATGIVCAVGYQYRAISFLGDLPWRRRAPARNRDQRHRRPRLARRPGAGWRHDARAREPPDRPRAGPGRRGHGCDGA